MNKSQFKTKEGQALLEPMETDLVPVFDRLMENLANNLRAMAKLQRLYETAKSNQTPINTA